MGLQCERLWLKGQVKGQPRSLKLIISNKNNDFGFNSIKKITFSENYPLKCIRKQI